MLQSAFLKVFEVLALFLSLIYVMWQCWIQEYLLLLIYHQLLLEGPDGEFRQFAE